MLQVFELFGETGGEPFAGSVDEVDSVDEVPWRVQRTEGGIIDKADAPACLMAKEISPLGLEAGEAGIAVNQISIRIGPPILIEEADDALRAQPG